MPEFQPVVGKMFGWSIETTDERQFAIRVLRERIKDKHEAERVIVGDISNNPLNHRIRRHIHRSRADLVLRLIELEYSGLRVAPVIFGRALWEVLINQPY